MAIYIHIFGDSDVSLWGLSGKERLQRQFAKVKTASLVDDLSEIPAGAKTIFIRADYLFDSRLLQAMVDGEEDYVLLSEVGELIVAVRGSARMAESVQRVFAENQKGSVQGLVSRSPRDFGNSHDLQLRKYDSLTLLPISEENSDVLERELFSGSYKGVTDFVTKWIWPVPARLATRFCVEKGLQPNHVTIFSLLLAILAGLAFWHGHFMTGLLMGWVMTFLDTVDGKLARVTVTSSKLGDVMDHGLDLIHPPFWYWAWAVGLNNADMLSPSLVFVTWLVFLTYIGGRLCEGLFELWLTRFPIFLWQEVDSFNRLITARRNPNMVLLTLSCLLGRPDIGLYLVIIWHSVSTLFLAWRVALAWRVRQKGGVLFSWLEKIDPERDKNKLAVRVFTRKPLQLEVSALD